MTKKKVTTNISKFSIPFEYRISIENGILLCHFSFNEKRTKKGFKKKVEILQKFVKKLADKLTKNKEIKNHYASYPWRHWSGTPIDYGCGTIEPKNSKTINS